MTQGIITQLLLSTNIIGLGADLLIISLAIMGGFIGGRGRVKKILGITAMILLTSLEMTAWGQTFTICWIILSSMYILFAPERIIARMKI